MYECAGCGFGSPRWMGFCPQCRSATALEASLPVGSTASALLLEESPLHLPIGMSELDRVLGGGLVPGAALLVGGEPGVGKSTLLSQVAAALGGAGASVLLAGAEESVAQVGMRMSRIGARADGISVLMEPNVDAIVATAARSRPNLVVVDSIQTVMTSEASGSAGGFAQVRECASRLVRFGKETSVPVVLVGHVTKDGAIGGPKLLEHMVDVVLYMEGSPDRGLRLVRNLKNRFGPTHEVGIYEMSERGLVEVADPSQALVGEWRGAVSGTVVYPAVEGRRPMLVEVQALVNRSSTPQPRRSVRGVEPARVHQLLAVLERHAAMGFGGHDVYVNVVGGLRIREPAADLAVAMALASSLSGKALGHVAAWGEVGLTGETRAVPRSSWRHAEVKRLGIANVLTPGEGALEPVAGFLDRAGLVGSSPHLAALGV